MLNHGPNVDDSAEMTHSLRILGTSALPRLRAVEDPGGVAEPRWSRQLAAHRARRSRAHSIARRRIADR
jgi:hypothetical protein